MPLPRTDAGDPQTIAADLAARFGELTGHDPTGVFAAPGRVNLIGEHVDYNGGLCLPIALEHATYAAVAPRADGTTTVASLQQQTTWSGRLDGLDVTTVSGWPTYVVGVLWALREDGIDLPALDVVVDSRVPLGAGNNRRESSPL